MTVKRIGVELNDFKSGRVAYFTKNFSTYYVRYVDSEADRIKVKVVKHLLIHENAMKRRGLKKTFIYPEGAIVYTTVERIWDIKKETINKKGSLFSFLKNLLGGMKN